jgi:hypothetical protein
MPNCNFEGCNISASYGTENKKVLRCSKHKSTEMYLMTVRLCVDCKKCPHYNFPGETKGIYCKLHSKENMIIVSKHCAAENCIKPAFYNYKNMKRMFCDIHKTKDMVKSGKQICNNEKCLIGATYGLLGDKKGLYCSKHKKKGMVNVKNKTCIECNIIPVFNKPGEAKALYCSKHKKEGMIDVKNKTCLECNKHPVFNKLGETTALYCSVHKKEGMLDIKSKTCIECNIHPVFNKPGETTAVYCSAHKKEGTVDVKNKTCKSEWCSTQVNEKYDGYCLFCYMNLFPDKPISRNYKTKEYSVVEYIKTKFPSLKWIADKIVSGGCSKRRPDLLLDLIYQIVIIEVDENQHINYDCSCQNKRIMELSQDLGHRPIVFIRFNPDDYNKNGISISSCWGKDKKGISVVKKTKKNEWTQRLNTLEEHINYWITPENTTNKTIETIQLFYDV